MAEPIRIGDDMLEGRVRMNWWVWFACECWRVDNEQEFYGSLERAFDQLANSTRT
jgi:hypothetical protein